MVKVDSDLFVIPHIYLLSNNICKGDFWTSILVTETDSRVAKFFQVCMGATGDTAVLGHTAVMGHTRGGSREMQ